MTRKTGLDHKTAATFCELIFTELQETLTNLDSVSVSGFGTFSAEKKDEHISFDPVTKEQLLFPPVIEINFEPSSNSNINE